MCGELHNDYIAISSNFPTPKSSFTPRWQRHNFPDLNVVMKWVWCSTVTAMATENGYHSNRCRCSHFDGNGKLKEIDLFGHCHRSVNEP